VFLTKCAAASAALISLFGVAAADEADSAPAATPVETAVPAEGEAAPEEAAPDQAAASTPVSETEQKSEQAADGGDKVVCKYAPKPGSRIGTKVCMTKDEWDQVRRDSREGVDNLQRQNTAPGLPQG
jgi:hypothetical protein